MYTLCTFFLQTRTIPNASLYACILTLLQSQATDLNTQTDIRIFPIFVGTTVPNEINILGEKENFVESVEEYLYITDKLNEVKDILCPGIVARMTSLVYGLSQGIVARMAHLIY